MFKFLQKKSSAWIYLLLTSFFWASWKLCSFSSCFLHGQLWWWDLTSGPNPGQLQGQQWLLCQEHQTVWIWQTWDWDCRTRWEKAVYHFVLRRLLRVLNVLLFIFPAFFPLKTYYFWHPLFFFQICRLWSPSESEHRVRNHWPVPKLLAALTSLPRLQ